jgi:anti-anti-sigma factor
MPGLADVEVLYPRAGAAVLECTGEHDLTIAPALEERFTELIATNDLVVIDVSEAQFIDSSFLHEIWKADRVARSNGSRVRLQVGTTAIVKKALEISGILDRIENAPSREEALALLRMSSANSPLAPDGRPACISDRADRLGPSGNRVRRMAPTLPTRKEQCRTRRAAGPSRRWESGPARRRDAISPRCDLQLLRSRWSRASTPRSSTRLRAGPQASRGGRRVLGARVRPRIAADQGLSGFHRRRRGRAGRCQRLGWQGGGGSSPG